MIEKMIIRYSIEKRNNDKRYKRQHLLVEAFFKTTKIIEKLQGDDP